MKNKLIYGTLVFLTGLVTAGNVFATTIHKVFICHYTFEAYETLYIDENGAKAHLKNHSLDYVGRCKTPSPTPTATPSATPSTTPSSTPSATPTATPTATPSPSPSSTASATPRATATPTPVTVNVVLPQQPPNTGLGGR